MPRSSPFARLAAVLLAAAALSLLGPALPARADVSSLGVESATVPPGASVTLNLIAEATDPGIGAFTVDITYDDSLVTATGCASPAGLPAAICNEKFAGNKVRFAGATVPGLTGHVVLGSVTFKAKDSPGIANLDVSADELTDPEAAPLDFAVGNGRLTIQAGVSPTVLPPTVPPGASRTGGAAGTRVVAPATGPTGAAAAVQQQPAGDSGGSSAAAWLLAGLGLAVVAGGVYAVSRLRRRPSP